MENEIIKNLKSDSSYELTDEELDYLEGNYTFILRLLECFSDKKEYWKNNYDLFSDILDYLFLDEEMQDLDVYYYRMFTLGESSITYDSNLLLEIDRVFENDSPYKKLTLDFFYSKLETDDNLKDACFNDYLTVYLIENGKYESLKKVSNVNDFSVSTAELFLKKYPYKEYGTPKFLYSVFGDGNCYLNEDNGYGITKVICGIGLENLDTKLLLMIFESNIYLFADSDIGNDITLIILNRLLNKDKTVLECFRDDKDTYNSFYEYLFDTRTKYSEIIKKLIENNIFLFADVAIKLNIYGQNTHAILHQRIYENLDNEYEFMTYLITNKHGLGLGYSRNIIDSLIKRGKLNIMINYLLLYSGPQTRKYIIESIIRELDEGNENYNSDINSLTRNIIKYPDILKAILRTKRIYNFSFLNNYSRQIIQSIDFTSTISLYMLNVGKEIVLPKNTNLSFMQDVFIKYERKRELIEWLSSISIFHIYEKNISTVTQILNENPEYISIIAKSINYIKFAFLNQETLEIALSDESFDKGILIDFANHNENYYYFYTKKNCVLLKNYIVKRYNIREKNFILLVNRIGPYILKYLESPNIKSMLNLDYETLEKILDIFSIKSYDSSDLMAAYDSIKQYEFTRCNLKIINCFSNIIHFLEYSSENFWENDEISSYIRDILSTLDEKFWNKFYKRYPSFISICDKEELVIYILRKIKTGDHTFDYKSAFHEFSDYYIRKKREKFRENSNMYIELQLPFKYDKKSATKYTILFLLEHDHFLFKDESVKPFSEWLEECFRDNGFPNLTFERFRNDVLNRNQGQHYFDSENLKKLWELANNLFSENWSNSSFIAKATCMYDIKKEYIMEFDYCEELVYEILSCMNLDVFISDVVANSKVYNSLSNIMKKRKIHILPNILKKYIKKSGLDLEFTNMDIAAFITNYKKIYEKECIKRGGAFISSETVLNLPNIIKNAIAYGSNIGYYSYILGNVDATLIKRNSGPNAACQKLKNNERLNEAVAYTISNFKRKQITVPAFNEIIEVNNKNIRVVVGNFTHPSNVTHGERTGACMRIGGVGESLFDFTLKNINGFHIRFENELGEYISRVSGFRNGNTVFLNQLRYSLNEDSISNKDLIKAIKITAKMIIDYSQNSSFPIENVVIDNSYVMAGFSCTFLEVNNIKMGLQKFYSDVSSSAVLLATSETKLEFAPLKLCVNNLPVYEPAREDVIYSENIEEIIDVINRVNALGVLLKSDIPEYELSPLDIEYRFVRGYANMDWYAYIDIEGNIHSKILDVDNRAKYELNNAIEKLKINKKKFNS